MKIEKFEKTRPLKFSPHDSAYMTLFSQENELSFVWDCTSGEIEVSRGGFGEPAEALITEWRSESVIGVKMLDVVRAFAEVCAAYPGADVSGWDAVPKEHAPPGGNGCVHIATYSMAENEAYVMDAGSLVMGVFPDGHGEPLKCLVRVLDDTRITFYQWISKFGQSVANWKADNREACGADGLQLRLDRVLNSYPRARMIPQVLENPKDEWSAEELKAMGIEIDDQKYVARLTVPGYMDSTDWSPLRTLLDVLEWAEEQAAEAAEMASA